MVIFSIVLCTILIVLDFFVISKQKKRIEELTKENYKLKKVIENKFNKVGV